MTAPHLRERACTSLFGCAVCPRPMLCLFVVEPSGFVALCVGCLKGFVRLIDEPRTPREVLG